eukprot:CAMPEP_0117890672 /NCGR_PEP_ID=MMETSP0950-20121206/23454_1 /TAXON_ID=44440 /ORGANISM="Chattonella subsalsa, Strain CCMP2191" /LENGTH=114 /DNA_ID=CAMNT_0005749953 /DNA_START=316 /DNA_END=656 /DNA_ORIENTATION=-
MEENTRVHWDTHCSSSSSQSKTKPLDFNTQGFDETKVDAEEIHWSPRFRRRPKNDVKSSVYLNYLNIPLYRFPPQLNETEFVPKDEHEEHIGSEQHDNLYFVEGCNQPDSHENL